MLVQFYLPGTLKMRMYFPPLRFLSKGDGGGGENAENDDFLSNPNPLNLSSIKHIHQKDRPTILRTDQISHPHHPWLCLTREAL